MVTNMGKVKVSVLHEYGLEEGFGPHASSYIRLLRPLTHPSLEDKIDVDKTPEEPAEDTDIVIFERLWKPELQKEQAESIVGWCKKKDVPLIYSIDDNLLDHSWRTRSSFGNSSTPSVREKMIIRYLTREADAVIAATKTLKRRLNKLNDNIYVLPNTLDERLFKDEISKSTTLKTEENSKTVIGYMGTLTHADDLMMIYQPLKEVFAWRDDVQLELCGVTEDNSLVDFLKDSLGHVLSYDPTEHSEYPDFIEWFQKNVNWDLGLAPLEDNEFTHYKSDIKFLHYSAFGIPGIYSSVKAYDPTVEHLKTGYLTENYNESWKEAIRKMVERDKLRRKIKKSARKNLINNRLLKQNASNWWEVIEQVL